LDIIPSSQSDFPYLIPVSPTSGKTRQHSKSALGTLVIKGLIFLSSDETQDLMLHMSVSQSVDQDATQGILYFHLTNPFQNACTYISDPEQKESPCTACKSSDVEPTSVFEALKNDTLEDTPQTGERTVIENPKFGAFRLASTFFSLHF
jgi:hypothetical protein